MHLTRLGFNLIVAVWLAPMLLVDFVGNTMTTGLQSDIYYYKAILDGLLVAYALYQAFGRPATASASVAQRRTAASDDTVIGFEKLGAAEYIYCALLVVYAGINWYMEHDLNKASTGIMSVVTLVWSILSIAVAILSAVQFWHLKSGKIVELTHKVAQ